MESHNLDIAIIGGGVIGLAVAAMLSRNISQNTKLDVAVIEREQDAGFHTSSRNSEVIHSGIYYPSDSLKAKFCVRGRELLYAYLAKNSLPFQRIGKLIVAQSGEESALEALALLAERNGVHDLEWWTQRAIDHHSPGIRATAAIWSPSTGIFDTHQYLQRLLGDARDAGVMWAPHTEVVRIEHLTTGSRLHCQPCTNARGHWEAFTLRADIVINCAGLWAQSIAKSTESMPAHSIPELHLCKGNYYRYHAPHPFRTLVYPIPNARLNGLGIHATLDMQSNLRFGPDTEWVDRLDYRVSEDRTSAFLSAIECYFPAISKERLKPDFAGIRPKLNSSQGSATDFVIQNEATHGVPGHWHLYGIESPGLTASLAIAEHIVDEILEYRS